MKTFKVLVNTEYIQSYFITAECQKEAEETAYAYISGEGEYEPEYIQNEPKEVMLKWNIDMIEEIAA